MIDEATGAADAGGTGAGFQITQMTGSFEAFGVTMDYLSRIEPFASYDLGNFSGAVRRQLTTGHHVAALAGLRLVGYCGWMAASGVVAEAWVRDAGLLVPADEPADAVALTTVAADDRRILAALIRRARDLNPGIRVFFKREYADRPRRGRKASVENLAPR